MTRARGSRVPRVVVVVLLAAAAGIGSFAVLVRRAVTVEDAARPAAERRITSVRARLPHGSPVVEIDDEGRLVHGKQQDALAGGPIRRLRAMAWRAAEQRLVTADAPFWFFKIKGPAARQALAGTGFDLDRLHLTPGDLEQLGPAIIVDHTSRDGSRLLVWTE